VSKVCTAAYPSYRDGELECSVDRDLVCQSIAEVKEVGMEEVRLVYPPTNKEFPSLTLYFSRRWSLKGVRQTEALSVHESLAFTRENRVFRFYMVGIAAFRPVIACLQTEVYLLEDSNLYIPRRRISLHVVSDWMTEFEDEDTVSER
jgi:hypothetical protein